MALKNAIVGYILIFVLVVVLRLTIKPLADWMSSSAPAVTSLNSGK